MALRSGYKGFKKLAEGLKMIRPGILSVDNDALSGTFFPRTEQSLLGSKNLCPNMAVTTTDGEVYEYNTGNNINVVANDVLVT